MFVLILIWTKKKSKICHINYQIITKEERMYKLILYRH